MPDTIWGRAHDEGSRQGRGVASVQKSGRMPKASMNRCQPEPTRQGRPEFENLAVIQVLAQLPVGGPSIGGSCTA